MIILLSNNVPLQRNFVRKQASDFCYNHVLGKWRHEGYAFHEQRTLSRRWSSSVILRLFYFLCLGKKASDSL